MESILIIITLLAIATIVRMIKNVRSSKSRRKISLDAKDKYAEENSREEKTLFLKK